MRHLSLALLALTALFPAPALPQTAASDQPGLGAEVARLNATLLEIKGRLERLTETQSLDLLMKRMELSSAQVTEMEKRLRSAVAEHTDLDDEREQMEMVRESYETESESDSGRITPEQLDAFLNQHEVRMARLKTRMASLDSEMSRLQNLLAAKQRELEDWQSYIDRRLGGL